jgi:hypothetical protein
MVLSHGLAHDDRSHRDSRPEQTAALATASHVLLSFSPELGRVKKRKQFETEQGPSPVQGPRWGTRHRHEMSPVKREGGVNFWLIVPEDSVACET